ncbi:MAG TPA: hypothetical protein VE397_02725, partial [Stellaceae bacterium]|nr:hypothetical protein [Stellaceae bacterium]
MSTRDGKGEGRSTRRIAATLNVDVVGQDRRGEAVPLSGAIGACTPYEPPKARERRSAGELGPSRDAKRPRRESARPASAVASTGEADVPAGSASADRGAERPAAIPTSLAA